MLSAAHRFVFTVLAQMPDLPGQPPGYVKPPGSTSPKYFEYLESHTQVIYPLLAVGALILILVGILQAWRTQDLDGVQKANLKKEIMTELRKDLAGMSVELIARAIGLETFRTMSLLEEMRKDGILLTYTNTQHVSVWQLKGVGPQRD